MKKLLTTNCILLFFVFCGSAFGTSLNLLPAPLFSGLIESVQYDSTSEFFSVSGIATHYTDSSATHIITQGSFDFYGNIDSTGVLGRASFRVYGYIAGISPSTSILLNGDILNYTQMPGVMEVEVLPTDGDVFGAWGARPSGIIISAPSLPIDFNSDFLLENEGVFNVGVLRSNTGNPIPEPTTMLLFGTGLAGFAAVSRRRT